MSDLNTDIRLIQLAVRGEDVRDAIVDALQNIDERTTEAGQGKQDTLTFDETPENGSSNPVTSGGIYTALSGKQDNIRVSSITLTTQWAGENPYTQEVEIPGVSEKTKVDLQPDAAVLMQMAVDGVSAIWIQNDNGTLTAFALGAVPLSEMTVQCSLLEVQS